MGYGMPPGFADALAEKYSIMRLQAEAQARALGSAANLDDQKARLLPQQSAADIGQINAETARIGATTKTIGPLAAAQIGLFGAEGRNYNASARNYDANAINTGYQSRGLALGLKSHSADAFAPEDDTGLFARPNLRYGFHFSQ